MCLLFIVANRALAVIAWEIELISDPNTNCTVLASCDSDEADRIYVITKAGPRGGFLHQEGNCLLWEIKEDGRITRRTLLTDKTGRKIRTNALPIGPGCAMAANSRGHLMTAGVSGEQQKDRTLAVLLNTDTKTADSNILWGDRIDNFSIKEMVPLRDDTFALIGTRRHQGVYVRIDDQKSCARCHTIGGRRKYFPELH